jgi:hypothetical protein
VIISTLDPHDYQPATCNIGPAEIAARRRSGHAGAAAAVALVAVLVAAGVPAPWRIVVAAPAAVSAAGYLQAAMRFCAAYGWAGVFNFSDRLRTTESVADARARAADRRRALEIGGLSLLAGLAAGILAVLLPV